MRLRNKKTGEIGHFTSTNWNEIALIIMDDNGVQLAKYSSLAELNEEWEDYEGQKEWYWFIEDNGVIQRSCHYEDLHPTLDKARKDIGNYFDTREEAEKVVEKLKAWKRLKDKKFRFTEWYKPDGCEPFIVVETNIDYDDVDNKELQKDLDLLFSQEED